MSQLQQRSRNRVVVIGAQGVLGRMIVDAFDAAGWAAAGAGRRPDPDHRLRQIDLDVAEPEAMARVLADGDLVVNVVPDEGFVAERTVLDEGGLLINVSALPEGAVRRLRTDSRPGRGGC